MEAQTSKWAHSAAADAAPTSLRARWDSESVQLAIGVLLIVLSTALPAFAGHGYWAHNFLIVNLFVTVAILQNLLLSDAGQLSFGQGAVFGIGAYMTGIVAGLWGFNYSVGVVGGLAAALAMGLLFAFPALRVQSFYLGFVTLSAALVFPEMLVAFSSVTNGINGVARQVPALTTPILGSLNWLSLLIMALGSAVLVGHFLFRRTALGRSMRVAAHSPEAAMTLGASPGQLRFIAFTLAAIGTGLAGALYVPVIGFVSPYAFRVELSIFFFFSVIVGGQGRLLGPIVGVWVLYLIPNVILADLAAYRLLAYGVIALIIMLAFPDGIIGTLESTMKRYFSRNRGVEINFDAVLNEAASSATRGSQSAQDIRIVAAHKAYTKMVALNDVSVSVKPRTIHAIVGPNGSGKTTLLNAISGLIRLDSGSISIGGVETSRQASYETARQGLGRTFQTPRVFEDMSIWGNIRIGADSSASQQSWLLRALQPYQKTWQAQRPDVLPHAQRRLLELLRILAMDSEIVLLDEPAAGLSSTERQNLAALLQLLRDKLGKTVILIEHDLHLVWDVADQITVLDAGEVVADGPPQKILDDPRVRNLFAGPVQESAAHA